MTAGTPCDRTRLLELLARYLSTRPQSAWPGTDGLTVEDVVVGDYLAEVVKGHAPRPRELIRLHPDLADVVREFFC